MNILNQTTLLCQYMYDYTQSKLLYGVNMCVTIFNQNDLIVSIYV